MKYKIEIDFWDETASAHRCLIRFGSPAEADLPDRNDDEETTKWGSHERSRIVGFNESNSNKTRKIYLKGIRLWKNVQGPRRRHHSWSLAMSYSEAMLSIWFFVEKNVLNRDIIFSQNEMSMLSKHAQKGRYIFFICFRVSRYRLKFKFKTAE